MSDPRTHIGRIAIILMIVGAAAGAGSEDLVTGQLQIRGAVLRVYPELQEVAPGLPTVVKTSLGQLEPGQIPAGLRVEGDLTGPGLDQPLRLTTTPGDVFRIPGLNREGTYTLSGIRLVEGDSTVSAADPDSVEILVHRLVISSITSRALTPDEMDAYGIVIDADNYTAWHYSVGFQIEGGTVEVPFDLMLGPQGITLLDSPDAYALPVPSPDFPEVPVPTVTSGSLEPIPRVLPTLDQQDMETLAETPIPGFIIIPTDIAFLNQFFSVIMVVQNGALAGSGLELRDLSGVLELSGDGIRQAETAPPTIPGQPVPVLDPGPDGEMGTSDDLTFIVAQASGQATWLVEGLREGQHRLTAHLTGEIHGLASGVPAPIEGKIPGVVVVRDPRFALTFFHPNTVRSGEYYDFRVSVTNVSTTPVYDLSLELPTNSISGARLLEADDDDYDDIEEGDNDPVQSIGELLPGTTGMVTWRLESKRTGRVVASAFNTSSPLDASFVFEIGVGELGIPLSPETIVLPRVVDDLPPAIVEPALELLGLAHSLANAPNGVEVDLPPVGETIVMLRGTELAAAGQRHAFGEPVARSVVGFGLQWMGASHWSSSFDVLRRQSRRGHELENATAFHLGERILEIGAEDALAEVEELAISGRPMLLVFAEGAGFEGDARLALVGNVSGHSSIGQRADVEFFSRELEGASILAVDAESWSGEIGVVAVPVEEGGAWFEGTYQIQLWGVAEGTVDLEVVLVMPDGGTRRFAPSAAVETGDHSLAYINVGPEAETTSIHSDINGNGIQDWSEPIDVSEQSAPPARVITAGFNDTINPVRGGPYRNVVLLISQPIDGDALDSVDAADWLVDSVLEIEDGQGGTESYARGRHGRSFRLQLDPRILIATFEQPLNPHAELRLSSGSSPLPLVGGSELAVVDQPITTGGGLETGVVRGVVLGPDGGPLANAIVELYELLEICHAIDGCNWYPNLSDRVSTDGAGGFLFDAVRYRDQTIPSQQAAFTVRAIDPSTGHEARLVARLPGDDQVRSLTLAMVGRGDVVGTLRNEDGSPLDNPLVVARSITNPSEGAQAEPDASGAFRLEDLPVGPVQVVATDGQAYTFATALISGPGAEASVDLVLQEFSQPLAQVEGSVIDGVTAEPVPGLDVYVIPAGFSGATHVATTNGEGLFSMANVPPGVARFKAWSPTLGRYVGEVVSDLLGDTTNDVEVLLQPGATGSIVGTVTLATAGGEQPVAGAYVVANDQGVFTLTDDQGNYQLTNLPLGKIRLETWDPVTAAATNREVDLTADGQVLVIDFVLRGDHGLGSVTVSVASSDGIPEAGAEVAIGWFGSSYGGRTIGDGRVRIEEVPPGQHDVLVRLGGRLARGTVKVLYPGHAAETSIVLRGLRDATIRVEGDTTGDGTSVPMTPISYRVPGVRSNGSIGQIPEDGWTSCELEEDHSCRVRNIPTEVGSLVAVATSGFYGPVTASKWIHDGGDHELVINFKALGVVGGRIVTFGPDGVVPVEGAIVELWTRVTSGLIPQSQYTTREDGVFQFDLVPLGEYSLRAYHESFGIQWLNGNVSAGQVIDDLELRLRGRASIEGEVALCFDTKSLKAGSQVRVSLSPNGVPRPFISDRDDEIEDFNKGVLDLTLDGDERATFSFNNRMVGGWTLSATSALHGSAWEPVSVGPPGETTILAETLCLHPTGSVLGRVTFPETGDPASSVAVQLFRRVSYYFEYLTTEATDDDGNYAFPDVPVGREYQVRAFDTASNRGGISATAKLCDASDSGYGTTCSRDAVLNLSLSPMGRLEGVLRDQNELGVGSAHVRLQTSVVLNQNGTVQSYQRDWTTFSSADGSYAFDGVPAGTAVVTAFDPDSPLFVEEQVSIDPVSSPTAFADLELPPTAEVAVRVLDPFGAEVVDGIPVVVFRQSSRSNFREPSGASPTVDHLTQIADPAFEGVVADRYKVGACFGSCSGAGVDQILEHKFNLALGAVAERWMSNPPSDQVVELELAGRATVAVTVTQGGVPVPEAVVRITGGGFYGTRDVSTQTQGDGTIIPIAGLGVGEYAVTASWSGLGGSREIEITQDDHDGRIELTIGIEESSSAVGYVVDPEGQPAEGALIKMIFGNRTFQTVSDGDGAFVFATLPISQIYRLEAYAANGFGRHSLDNIVVGTDPIDLGVLVLDELNPWVAGVSPSNGGQDADTEIDVVIDFAELMRWGTLTGDRIKLREHGSGSLVSTVRTIEDQPDPDGDGPLLPFTRVTLSHGPLASEKLYLLDVLKSVEDLAGRRPAFDFHSTFRTRDTVPPQVFGVSPANDIEGRTPVAPDVVPIVSFSESMDPESVDSSTVRLLDGDEQPVEAVLDLQRDGFDIRIRPTTALDLDTFYTIVIDGVTDAAGLPLPTQVSSTFRVRDIEPPVVSLLAPEGSTVEGEAWSAIEGRPLTLRAAVSSNDLLKTVAITYGGVPDVVTPDASGEYRREVVAPVGVPDVAVSVQAEDVSGNLSLEVSHLIFVIDDQPPSGQLTVDHEGGIHANHVLGLTVAAEDDHGLSEALVTVSGAATGEWTLALDGTSDEASASLRVPVDTTAGTQILITCELEDTFGQRTVLPPQAVTVLADAAAPAVAVISPADGAAFRMGEVIEFEFDLEDDVVVDSVSLVFDGEILPVSIESVTEPGTSWTARATAERQAPEVAETSTMDWSFSANDAAGNHSMVSRSVTVTPPDDSEIPQISFVCPTDGAMLPAGYDNLVVRAHATDDEGVVRVEFYVGDEEEPFSTRTSSPRRDTYTNSSPGSLPSAAGAVRLRIRAYDELDYMRESTITVQVVNAVELDATGANDWEALEDQMVYLADGILVLDEPRTFAGLMVVGGASISHPECEPGSETRLDLTVNGPVYLGCGSGLDATGKGYPGDTSYPGEIVGGPNWGGSHMGEAGVSFGGSGSVGSTYGSVYQPMECGAGASSLGVPTAGHRGGGVIRLVAESLALESTAGVFANTNRSGSVGAGGSVWLSVAEGITGSGAIEAGQRPGTLGYGGGGAIALEYAWISPEVFEKTAAFGGEVNAAPGTIYLRDSGGGAVRGELRIDNKLGRRDRLTVLPSMGSGVAGAGSLGATLDTGLPSIQPYFVGHWIEVTDQLTQEVRGIWRVAAIAGGEVSLEPNDGEAILIEPGDPWRGIYRFDKVTAVSHGILQSADPIEVSELDIRAGVIGATFFGMQSTEISGQFTDVSFEGPISVSTSAGFGAVSAESLRVEAGARIYPHSYGAQIDLKINGDVVLEDWALISAVGTGYAGSYPGTTYNFSAGGSHLGYGNSHPTVAPGSTYGSVTQPREAGAGGGGDDWNYSLGGGVIRIEAGSLLLEGASAISADGEDGLEAGQNGGAGGSVWITVEGDVLGTGSVTANGGGPGPPSSGTQYGGGGGAVSAECLTIDPDVKLVANGSDYRPGGAGTVYLNTEQHVFGDLTVAAGINATTVYTSLPGLGYGEAREGSHDDVLETGRPIDIPPFFEGHWVEIRDPFDTVEGMWRIGSVDGSRLTLVPDGLETISVDPGDRWQGVYRFDAVTVTDALLSSGDEMFASSFSGFVHPPNESWPSVDIDAIEIAAGGGGFSVTGYSDAVTDPSGILTAKIVNTVDGYSYPLPVQLDGSFAKTWVSGNAGDILRLEVTDAHPSPLVTVVEIGSLPPNDSPPAFDEDWIRFLLDAFGDQHLVGARGAITDGNPPVELAVTNQRTGASWQTTVAVDGSFGLVIEGIENDEFLLTATDRHPDRLSSEHTLVMPLLEHITVSFEYAAYPVIEDAGGFDVNVVLSNAASYPVLVRLTTIADTASDEYDFGYIDKVITIDPGSTVHPVRVEIFDDPDIEDDETFRLDLSDPLGAELAVPSSTEVTIRNDDVWRLTVPFSVAVGAPNFLPEPIDVNVVGGVAIFAQPLPLVVGRGDRLEVEGFGSIFIDRCTDDSTCTVVTGRGLPPIDAYGVQATVATAAFGSLAEAVDGAADADHLGTYDLVAGNRALELVCYGGFEDTTAVVIEDWVTSPENNIRIVAADESYGHDGSWRHRGRWSGSAYRVEVDGTDCISTTVGNLTIEGLQIGCGAGPDVGVAGIRVGETSGSLEISETLIMLDGTSGAGQRAGIAISSSEALEVEVRNSILWDLGDSGNEFQAGILVDGPGVSLWAANNTIVGGGYGIHNVEGTVTALNNLVAGSALASYEGDFELDSTLNLGSDDTAPDPPANAVGPVTVTNPVPSHDADFHLRCGVLDQPVTIGHDFEIGSEEDLWAVFDGNSDTLLRSASINPARVRLDFGGQRAVIGTSVVLSHHDLHEWMVAAADSVADLEAQSGSYRELVPWRSVDNPEMAWDGVSFDSVEAFEVIELLVRRVGGDDYVHINEWSLESLNPACGQGTDLTEALGYGFARDVDSVTRTGAWDIGADQVRELSVGFVDGPSEWWEEERTARIQVVLSEPAPAEVRLRYRTESQTAVPVDDYEEKTGELVFEPGDFSKIIRVTLVEDDDNDDDKFFAVVLFDVTGANLENPWQEIRLREGTPLPRIQLEEELIDAYEADGVARVWIRLNDEQEENIPGTWDAIDGSAHIGADYRGLPWADFTVDAGQDVASFEFELVDDDVAEGVEGFLIKGGDTNGAMLGVPSVGWVRIVDDDGGLP